MKLATVVLMLLAHPPLSVATAQDDQYVILLPPRTTVSDTLVRHTCTTIPRREPYSAPTLTHSCRVISFDTLPNAAGKRWRYAVQRHVYVYDFSDSAKKLPPDTLSEIETILYSGAPSSRVLTAVLYARADEEIIREIRPELAPRSGAPLMSMALCFNGTGGCWQEFFRYDGAAWHRIANASSAIQSRVVQAFHGDSSHRTRAPWIDVRTLHGTAGVSAPNDPNCCSSHRAEFDLVLEGNRFRIVRFKVVANDR